MRNKILFFSFVLCLASCSKRESKTEDNPILPRVPKETEAVFEKAFPGVLTGPAYADSIIRYINRVYHVSTDKILMGASTCVDDIIYTKNFRLHKEIKGPFHLGGLAGLPFTGISGLEAFAHHIPDDGVMLLIITPHIGYSQSSGWGFVLRHEQHEASTCCGALMGTLRKLEDGKLNPVITEDDYQGGKISEMALLHQNEIKTADHPIIELTKITSLEAEKQIREHILEVDLKHVKYIMITTGIMINTDYTYTDYLWMQHFMVYDVSKKAFIEELKK
ncbi:MAG TPA: hypothetical protein VGQ59_01715 [Cyclobacteriaceae bacterium]|nr:hypothetical protein [Cyclobacteriaceae bacterium]